MKQADCMSVNANTPDMAWNTPSRLLHWLTAASMAGAAFLTAPGHAGHAALGLIALGMLLIQLSYGARGDAPAPALWVATVILVILNLSGWLAPEGAVHTGATLASVVIAAFYCASVLFEALQRITARMAASDLKVSKRSSSCRRRIRKTVTSENPGTPWFDSRN